MNIKLPILFLLTSAFLLLIPSGCIPEEKPDIIRINKEVDRRIVKYKQHKRRNCIDKIIKEVERAVDSTLLHRAISRKEQLITIPQAGKRPEKPDVDVPRFTIEKDKETK